MDLATHVRDARRSGTRLTALFPSVAARATPQSDEHTSVADTSSDAAKWSWAEVSNSYIPGQSVSAQQSVQRSWSSPLWPLAATPRVVTSEMPARPASLSAVPGASGFQLTAVTPPCNLAGQLPQPTVLQPWPPSLHMGPMQDTLISTARTVSRTASSPAISTLPRQASPQRYSAE